MTTAAEAVGLAPDFLARVVRALRERGETVATAESLTGGLVCATLTTVPGASAVVAGGMIVYSTPLKARLAKVDGHVLDRHGAVHPSVAEELARAAVRECLASWGLGLTGVAGPGPQDDVRPGTVHIGLDGPDGTTVRTIHAGGDREAVRAAAVRAAVRLLAASLAVT